MDRFERLSRFNAREDLIDELSGIKGTEPAGIRRLLGDLADPAIIEHTIRYFQGLNNARQCLNFEHPWNCAREAEAKYKNIQFGWSGGAGGIGLDESWCEPCRDRVLNND
jgi:hypothetical protein